MTGSDKLVAEIERFEARLVVYRHDGPLDGRHSDLAGANAYELIDEAADVCASIVSALKTAETENVELRKAAWNAEQRAATAERERDEAVARLKLIGWGLDEGKFTLHGTMIDLARDTYTKLKGLKP